MSFLFSVIVVAKQKCSAMMSYKSLLVSPSSLEIEDLC